MAAVDYEREALRLLGLPHPADEQCENFHHIGETELCGSVDACRAIVARRLDKIRRVLGQAHTLSPLPRARIEAENFFSYGEYLDALRRIVSIRERLQRIENAERRRDFDRQHRDNPTFHAEHLSPSPLEERLSGMFDPDRCTPDWPGYVAYLATVAPSLCEFFYRRLPVLIPEDARRRHTYITGQSGSGKSELLKVLFNAYLRSRAPVSLVLIDPHGDIAEQVARLPEVATSGRLIYVHPYLAEDRTPTINPFELADQSEKAVHTTAEQIASVFDELMRRAGHATLTGNMGALLVPCISTLLRRPGSSIRDLQTFMDDKRNGELVEAGCRSPVQSHREFFQHQFFGKQYDSTKAALYTRIQSLLNSPVLYRLLVGRSTVNLEEAVNTGKIIIFALPKGEIGADTSPTFGSFVLAMLQGLALRRVKIPEADRMPVHVFVDECQNFLSPSVQTILTENRKFGLHLTLAQQTFAQDMDKDIAAAVVGNTAVKMCGMNDVKTLKPMDERMAVGLDALQQLGVGQFFVKVSGNTPAFKLIVPRIRDHLSDEAWAITKEAQLRHHYRPNTPPPAEGQPEAAMEVSDGRGTQAPPADSPPRQRPPKPRKVDFV
ncbi:MAG: ATP-binding protein [Magnetospirillum sp.]|nr:ATP-binding protein [Magnetospirillum sp.]